MQKRVSLAFFVVLSVVIGLSPLLSMLWHSFIINGQFGFTAYQQVLNSKHQWQLMGHSLLLASLVTTLTVLLACPWLYCCKKAICDCAIFGWFCL